MKAPVLLAACVAVAACAGPLAEFDRLSDIEVAGGTASVAATGEDVPLLSDRSADLGPVEAAAVAAAARQTAAAPPRGLFAMLGLGGPARAGQAGTAPAPIPARAAQPAGPGGALGGADGAEVTPGTVVPYGQIARVCGRPRNRLGSRLAAASGFEIWDTIPNSTAPRTHYVTGFDDGCARSVTGALVMTGDAATHEALRALPPSRSAAASETDAAFEAIKSRVCRVGRGQPCGDRIGALDRNTLFLTVYDRFGSSDRWVEVLLHDGAVAAIGRHD